MATTDECFFIAPIGKEGSQTRRVSDGVLRAIVEPAARNLRMVAIRADHIVAPGMITTQIVDKLIDSRMVVADVTGGNPNVFYELAVRHTFRKPAALIGREDETLPFDLHGLRMVPYRPDDLTSVAKARDDLEGQMKAGLEGVIDSPVATAVDVRARRKGSIEHWVADLLRGFRVARRSDKGRPPAPAPEGVVRTLRKLRRDLDTHAGTKPELQALADSARAALEELEGYSEPPQPPPFRPRDDFYRLLEARALEERWLDLETLSRLLRDDLDDDEG